MEAMSDKSIPEFAPFGFTLALRMQNLLKGEKDTVLGLHLHPARCCQHLACPRSRPSLARAVARPADQSGWAADSASCLPWRLCLQQRFTGQAPSLAGACRGQVRCEGRALAAGCGPSAD